MLRGFKRHCTDLYRAKWKHSNRQKIEWTRIYYWICTRTAAVL